MVDAWGKVPSGILSGNFIEPGDFLECINLHGEYESETLNDTVEVKGKYCQSYFLPNVAALGGSSTSDHQTRAVSVPELYVREHYNAVSVKGSLFDFNSVSITGCSIRRNSGSRHRNLLPVVLFTG